jgi:hypothetical protein
VIAVLYEQERQMMERFIDPEALARASIVATKLAVTEAQQRGHSDALEIASVAKERIPRKSESYVTADDPEFPALKVRRSTLNDAAGIISKRRVWIRRNQGNNKLFSSAA